MISRRQAIAGLGMMASGGTILMPRMAFADLAPEKRAIIVILRGGLDGLAAVAPIGDRDYHRQRRGLVLGDGDRPNWLIGLDGFFGLHPALKALHPLYEEGEMLAVQAVASAYRGRSHFAAQDVLENGTASTRGADDGWLNRVLAGFGEAERRYGLSIGPSVPLILRGDVPVVTWALSTLPGPSPAILDKLQDLYSSDSLLAPALAQARDAAGTLPENNTKLRSARGRRNSAEQSLAAMANLLLARNGPRIAVLETGGWDTHANQGTERGRLASQLSRLGKGLAKLPGLLGQAWQDTVVVVVSEFGRTVKLNGTGGTDHGTGGAALLLGGAVNGGRVIANWPGLADQYLHEGRDLKPTLDVRQIFKSVLISHLGVETARVEDHVFPGSRDKLPLENLFRG